MKIVEGNEARNEVMKELNFIERIFFRKKFIKVYNKVRINIVNAMLK